MKNPSQKTIKRLFALSGNLCAFPGCDLPITEKTGTITGEICHISAKNKEGSRYNPDHAEKFRNSFENLILLCRRHHKVIDSEPSTYSEDVLVEIKKNHEGVVGRPEQKKDLATAKKLLKEYSMLSVSNNTGNVAINSPRAIQGETVNVKTTKEKISIEAPAGTIGADRRWSSYILHLIKRYNAFADSDKTRKNKFSYGAITNNIETNFGASWRLLPIEKASTVSKYLHGRINKTKLARMNKGKGHKSYSTFEEYIKKYEL